MRTDLAKLREPDVTYGEFTELLQEGEQEASYWCEGQKPRSCLFDGCLEGVQISLNL